MTRSCVTITHFHVLSLPDEQPVDVAGQTESEDDVEDWRQDREDDVQISVFGPPEQAGHPVCQPHRLPQIYHSRHIKHPIGRSHFQLIFLQVELLCESARCIDGVLTNKPAGLERYNTMYKVQGLSEPSSLPGLYTLGTRAAEHKGCNWGMQIDGRSS